MTKSKKEAFCSFLVLGNTEVGKTCFILRYCDNVFQDTYLMTMGIDFKFKKEVLENGNKITVRIFDTAGQERFWSMPKNHYKASDGILLIYDVTKKSTFDGIREWIERIKEKAPLNIQIVLIGNKIDDIDNRVVSTEEGSQLAKEHAIEFFEVSAKDNINIREAVMRLVNLVMNIKKEDHQGLQLVPDGNKKKNCC